MLSVVYRIFSVVMLPLLSIYLLIRILVGKESRNRILERLGISSDSFTDKSSVIWIHAASIGEVNVAINLIKNLQKELKNYNFLVTSHTASSAKFVEDKLPKNTLHQFVPIDEFFSVKRFLKRWNPIIGIFIESEIWPNLLGLSSEVMPMILVNARLSDHSYKLWRFIQKLSLSLLNKNILRRLFDRFSLILTQSDYDYQKFSSLDCQKIKNLGNLKFSNPLPSIDYDSLEILKDRIADRKIMLAISTHHSDEEVLIKTYQGLRLKYPDLLLILAPRHLNRIPKIIRMVKKYDMIVSTDCHLINKATNCYIFNVMGKLGTVLEVAKVTFVGGSFSNGGHNFIEASHFDTAIILGPDVSNFQSMAECFLQRKAAIQIKDQSELLKKMDELFLNKTLTKNYITNAKKLSLEYSNIMGSYIREIRKYIKK